MPGFSINDTLIKLGVKLDDGTPVPEAMFQKLIAGRINVVVMQSLRGDFIINTKFKDKVQKIEPPLEKKYYFLMLSKDLVEKENKLAHEIWNAIPEIRKSKKYIEIKNSYFSVNN